MLHAGRSIRQKRRFGVSGRELFFGFRLCVVGWFGVCEFCLMCFCRSMNFEVPLAQDGFLAYQRNKFARVSCSCVL